MPAVLGCEAIQAHPESRELTPGELRGVSVAVDQALGSEGWTPEDELASIREQLRQSESGLRGRPPTVLLESVQDVMPADCSNPKVNAEWRTGCFSLALAVHKYGSDIENDALAAVSSRYFTDVRYATEYGVVKASRLMLYQSFDELMGIFTVGYTRGFTHANINQILGYNRTDPIQEIEACYERITDSINAIGDHPHLTPANIRILSLQALRGSQDRIASFVEKAEERQDSSPLPRWASNSLHQRTTDPEVEQKTLGTISRLKDIFGSDIGNTVATQCAVYYPTQCEALIEASYTESGAANALRQAREAQARIDLRRQAGKKPLPYDVLLVLDGRRAEKMQQQPMGAQLTAAIARGRSAQSRIDQAGAKGKKPRQQDLDLAAKGTKAKQTLITLDARTPSPAANACTPLTDVNPAVNERRRQFFFAEERTTDEDYAKALCMACDLVERCREEGVTRGEVGIWGGTNNSERRGLLRQRVTAVLTGKRDDPTLRIAIDSVSDQSRVVLELKSQGLTNSQIAEKIGSNVTNVANTYTNGIDQLTNSLRAQYDEEAIGQIAAIAAELQAAKA